MFDEKELPEDVKSTVNAMSSANAATSPLAGGSSVPPSSSIAPAPEPVSAPTPTQPSAGATALTGSAPLPRQRMTFSEQVGHIANKLGIPAGTGGWAKSLVGAGVTALAGGLQDVDTTPGGGAIAGVAGTLRNRNARLEHENQLAIENRRADQKAADEHTVALGLDPKSQAMIAHENAAMVHEQTLTHQLGAGEVDRSITDGKTVVANLTSGENPAPIIEKSISSADLEKGIKDKKYAPDSNHAYPTSKEATGEDKDGHTLYTTMYTVVGNVPAKKVDASVAALINKYMPDQKVQEGQELSGALYGSLVQQASSIAAATAARNQTLIDADVKSKTDAQKLEAVNLGPDWNNALANSKNDPLKALAALEAKPEVRAKYPNLTKDVMDAYGGPKEWETMRSNREKDAQKWAEIAAKKIEDVGGLMTDDMKAQIGALAPDKKKFIEQFPPDIQGAIMAVGSGPGDIKFRDVFTRMAKGQPGLTPQQAINAITQIFPSWSMQQYERMSKAYHDIMEGPDSLQIKQFNNILEHGAILEDTILSSGRGKNPAFLNTAVNLMESKGWGGEATKIRAEISAVKDEYEGLLNAGHKPGEQEKKEYDEILAGNATPAMIGAFLKAMGAVGAVRLKQIDDRYRANGGAAKRGIPGILTQDARDAAIHLNLDPESMRRLNGLNTGGDLFENPRYQAPTKFDLQKKANDQQGQQAAVKAATQAAAPEGTFGTAKGKDGNMYYVDANHKVIGRVQ